MNTTQNATKAATVARARAVDQLDLETGEVIASFPMISVAQDTLGIGNIYRVLCGEMHHAGGFAWRYADGKPPNKKPSGFSERQRRAMLGTKLSEEHKEKIRLATNRNCQTNLNSLARCSRAGNLHKRKAVQQLDAETGEVVATFCSVTEAMAATGERYVSLRIRGHIPQVGRWVWRWL